MKLRLVLASTGLAVGALSACADGSSFVEKLPAGVSVIDYSRSGASFNCSPDAFDNGNCAMVMDNFCSSIGRATEDSIGVLPDESVDAHLGWAGVSCFSRWKDTS